MKKNKIKFTDCISIISGAIGGASIAGLFTSYQKMSSARTEVECEKAVKNIKTLQVVGGVSLAVFGGNMALSSRNFDKFTDEDIKNLKEEIEKENEKVEEEVEKMETVEIDDSDIEIEES